MIFFKINRNGEKNQFEAIGSLCTLHLLSMDNLLGRYFENDEDLRKAYVEDGTS